MRLFGIWFEHELMFLALLVVPLLVWRMLSLRGRGRVEVPSSSDLTQIHPGFWARVWWLPDLFRVLALVVLIIALARPQEEARRTVAGEGVDIMVALDMSASMNAVDAPRHELERIIAAGETPNSRFDTAIDILEGFVGSRSQEHRDRIGLVIFGAQAWLKYPLTLDYGRLIDTFQSLVLDSGQKSSRTDTCNNGCTISGAGTALGDALGRAYNRLRRSESASRIVMLITDGKREGGSLDPRAIARHIRDQAPGDQVKVFTFLVGSNEETWFPSHDLFGRAKRLPDGRPVYEQLNRPMPVDPDLLREIATMTGGKFFLSENEKEFREDIKDLEQEVFVEKVEVSREDVFLWLIVLVLGLLALEHALRFTRFRSIA